MRRNCSLPRPVLAVIPARYSSSRLPGKMLLRETGKFLVQHVYENLTRCNLVDMAIIATDDRRIFQAAEGFGAKVVMTSPRHPSGTDRVAEVAAKLDCQLVVNVQGDEPEISPQWIDLLCEQFSDRSVRMATLAYRAGSEVEPENPHLVKVVVDQHNNALYFSRAPIPFFREDHDDERGFLCHVGIYAYRRETLLKFTSLPPSLLERAERLEQLRALENGIPIRVVLIPHAPPKGIDTAEDYRRFVERWQSRHTSQLK